MSRKLILTAILAIASSFDAVAHDSDVNAKSLAAAEAAYAKSALVFQQMREMRK